jgi:Fe-S cluster assembly ATP-binding protein
MLRIEELTLIRDNKTILKKINLIINAGNIYGVLGPNGAGKSSLAYSIMGCQGYKPNEGKIIFEGQEITNLPIWKRAKLGITLAWQEPARFEGITVEDYIQLGMIEKDRMKAELALQKVFLEPNKYLKRRVDKKLSGGERKRIELAAIFAMQPRLAILDEPDSGIDILTLNRIMDLIYEIKEMGTTVILITHQAEVAKIAEKAALIGEGYLVKEGSSKDIVEYYENKCLYCDKFQ